MPIPNSAPTRWVPKGLTDADDGSRSFPGAQKQLVNLIPDPSTAGVYTCRPAAQEISDFTGTNAPPGAGDMQAMLTVGDLEYGMIASTLFAGKDAPYCRDLEVGTFLPIAGITNANSPTTQPSSGDWTPPIIVATFSRVIVTHPGFPGDTIKFGWFDVSSFSDAVTGNEHSSTLIDGAPSILGVQPGMLVNGVNIPANTSVVSTADFILTTSALLANNTLTSLGSTLGIAVGQFVEGIYIPAGTIIDSITTVNSVWSGDIHSNKTIDNLIFVSGPITLATIGDVISGAGIPADTEIVAVVLVTFTVLASLNGTTTIQVQSTDGIEANQSVSGSGIVAGTRVVSVTPFTLTTTGNITNLSNVITNLASTTGVLPGHKVVAFGIPPSNLFSQTTVVVSVDSPTQVTINSSCTSTIVGDAITFSGGSVLLDQAATDTINFDLLTFSSLGVTLNKAATATATGVSLTISTITVNLSNVSLNANPINIPVVFTGTTITLSQAATGSADKVKLAIVGGTVRPFSLATTGNTHTNTTLDSLASTAGVRPGMTVSDGVVDIPAGTFVVSVDSDTSVTLSVAATGTHSAHAVTFSSTVTGPLWGAGDCDRNPLPSVPLGVMQMNGRAYFADGPDGIPFSDSGLPCRRSNLLVVQALTTNDGSSVTAIAPLELSAPLTGGIVQAAIAFSADGSMRQITGDLATNNLRMDLMPVATGTLAPLTIVPCILGTAFVSPQGLRFVRPDGSITDPVGVDGQGVTHPFQYAVHPSRMCAEANVAVLRITVQHGSEPGQPFQEFWFDLSRKTWTGPHTFPARMIQHWRSTFVMAPLAKSGSLWRSDSVGPAMGTGTSADFIENGAQLNWTGETVLLPDNDQVAMNAMVEANLMCAAAPADTIQVVAINEQGGALDGVLVVPTSANSDLRQHKLKWTHPIVFKQVSIQVRGTSNSRTRIGSLYMRHQILGYNNDEDALNTTYLRVIPMTGDTLTALSGLGAFRIDPIAELATLTVVMPPFPADGDQFCISTTQTIDSMTVTGGAGGATMAGTSAGPFKLNANGGSCWQYDMALNEWMPVV